MNFLVVFFILSIINVVGSTIRSIATISGSKLSAALWNAGYFSFYNIILIYTVMDFPMWEKCVITFVTNFIGVYIVKFWEQKKAPEKMWKIEMAIPVSAPALHKKLDNCGIEHNFNTLGNWIIYNCYCYNKEASKKVLALAKEYNGKVSAFENVLS